MIRRVHAIFALAASVIVCFMAITGAVLSLNPASEQITAAGTQSAGLNVAAVAASVADHYSDIDKIVRTASGSIVVYYYDATGTAAADYVDPATGASLGPYETSGVFGFFTELHRSLFLGDAGRIVTGIAALALAILAVSGMMMVVRRLGGWRHLVSRARGSGTQRLHVNLARFVIVGLLLSALTGVYMSLVTFGFVSDGSNNFLPFPDNVDGGTPATITELAALQQAPLTSLRELVFPFAGDPSDVFTLTTASGVGYVDQATGALLDFTPNSFGQSLYEAIYLLHTGEGAWWLGLLLGIAALSVPVMAASGIVIWWRRRREAPRISGNVRPGAADVVILVGSEGNSTWGFAGALHQALIQAGRRVHIAPMNRLARNYPRAQQVFVLTATYGDGGPPASANRFLNRLQRWRGEPPAFAVLGFGDRSFAQFCQFATDVEVALTDTGWRPFHAFATVDRQSSQTFERWGREIGDRLGVPLQLAHVAARPQTVAITLEERTDYGAEVQAPTAVLRFALPRGPSGLKRLFGNAPRLARFEAGDLVGIIPPGMTAPRYYSLASSSGDGYLEICVRKQSGGACSEFLHGLQPGDRIDAFVKSNPDFRPRRGKRPIILIGAGTGIAPFIGFIGANDRRRPIHLYWGGRDPDSDFLYGSTLARYQRESRLTRLLTAFSRVVGGSYVQDRIRGDGEALRSLVQRGAQILVCGGKEMAQGVRAAIEDIIAPLGTDVGALKAAGRYLEDVY